jgi:hypothetical protein
VLRLVRNDSNLANFVVHFPTYFPNEQEKQDAVLYANNVRILMCEATNLKSPDARMTLSNARFETRNY